MAFKFLDCLVLEKNQLKFVLASFKTLSDSESSSESHIKFLFRLSFALIGQFLLVYIHSQLSEQS
jgi:hypothetical protein